MLLRFLFFIVSVILYLYSPNDYDYNFCLGCTLLFIIEVIICLKNEFRQGNYLSFNLIFFFSFFWTSFAYPVLIYDTTLGYLNIMVSHINWSVLSHSTSLCLVFASTYLLGYGSPKLSLKDDSMVIDSSNGKSDILLKVTFIILVIFAFIYLARAGFSYEKFSFDVALWDLYFVALAFCLIEHSRFKTKNCGLKQFYKLNKFPLISAFFIIILFLSFGDRGPVIKVLLVIGAIYNFFYRKLDLIKIVIAGVIGIALMFFIRQTRENDNLISAATNTETISRVFDLKGEAIYMFADLYGATMELNIAYDYKERNGLFHPERVFTIPLTIVPFVPTIVLGIFDSSMDDFSTGRELNREMSQFNSNFGNHVVGDLYMSTGFCGVVFFALIFGSVSSALTRNRFKNINNAVAYMMLFAVSLYLPRDTVFALVRPIALSYIVGALIYPKQLERHAIKSK